MKGIVLAGGSGTRLRPLTRAVCKQLLPVFDKPMLYYPLATLMLAGVREIAVISTPHDLPLIQRLLGTGESWGLSLRFLEQPEPRGIAEALVLARSFLGGSASALVLGDNLLYSDGLSEVLQTAAAETDRAQIFGYQVREPSRYGVLAFDERGEVVDIVEKPTVPPSRFAVPGLYFYPGDAPERAAALRPSTRGELEITDLNRSYLADGLLDVRLLGRGVAWLDMGSPETLADASVFVRALQARQGVTIGAPEEVAWRQGWIDDDALRRRAEEHAGTEYGRYLRSVLEHP